MGLDQYAKNGSTGVEFAYWRKHNRLQGWMENLWRDRGGVGEFNVEPVEVTAEDLNRLEEDIRDGQMPETGGFFFGSDSMAEYTDSQFGYAETDRSFIAEARKIIAKGESVVYSSWW
jgi:hypothetical protein